MNSQNLEILCLEDTTEDAILIREQLKGDGFVFQFDHVATESEFIDRLTKSKYDIIFSDFNLPGYSGIAALVFSQKTCPDIPFICISGKIGEDMAVELIQLGASDYVSKDKLHNLPVAIKRALKEAEERKSRIEAERALEKLSQRLDEIREEERASISRAIHDQLGQSLTALKIDVEWLIENTSGAVESQAKLKGMDEIITNLIIDVQRIASDLRPPIIDDLGLVAAMEWYIKEFGKRTGIKSRFKSDEIQFTNEKRNLTIYRILQEGLTNVSRHAGASNIRVTFNHKGDKIVLTISDDGRGLSKEAINSYKSLGLIGIRERLKQYDGSLDIQSDPGKGTKLCVTIPFS